MKALGIAAAACAAAILIPLGVRMSMGLYQAGTASGKAGQTEAGQTETGQTTAGYNTTGDSTGSGSAAGSGDAAGQDSSNESGEVSSAEKNEISNVLTPAKNYETLYEKLKSAVSYRKSLYITDMAQATENASPADAGENYAAQDSAAAGTAHGGDTGAAADTDNGTSGSADSDHSDTNLRENGIDEGDGVKTDGRYLYILNDEGVRIISADGGTMSEAAFIDARVSAGRKILEMYVADDRLILLTQDYGTVLSTIDDTGSGNADSVNPAAGTSQTYQVLTRDTVTVSTYDITDRTSPELLGQVTADGYYSTSRLADGVLYLMTQYDGMYGSGLYTDTDSSYAETSFLESGAVPGVNGTALEAGDIYLPENVTGDSYLLLTSVKLSEPAAAADSKAILSYAGNVYVSSKALYLITSDWMNYTSGSTIVRIDYADGSFTPSGACTVPGEVLDTFCIDESSDGYLRVASTSYGGTASGGRYIFDGDMTSVDGKISESGTTSNGVYIFDREMNPVGSVTGIAPGEKIQSARFLDNVCYLVTYKNMDPLFSIDLSDPANPKLLGELSIPGFSQYLHFWSGSLLFGLGCETDPESGAVTGLKLSMFDISDPSNVTETSKTVLENLTGADALYNYRALLINPEKNIIGFSAYSSDSSTANGNYGYQVFSYENGSFYAKWNQILTGDDGSVRGVYIGSTFYLVRNGAVTAYDMNAGYAEIGKI
jgi:uncharacterized secreted protein with C-terminal beta-propeller domain